MDEVRSFRPAQKNGLIFHAGLLLFLLAIGSALLFLALNNSNGSDFLLWLILALICFAPVPFILYRVYALLQARYHLQRDGLRMIWGLRSITIPLDQIEWVRPLAETAQSLRLPGAQWPGAILGRRDTDGIGQVEYLASDRNNLTLVATPEVIYAISPTDAEGFKRAFRDFAEMGSLAPLKQQSVQPIAYVQSALSNRIIRFAIVSGVLLVVALFVLVALIIPGRNTISLGFDNTATPLPEASSMRLFILPVLAGMVLLVDLVAGLFFYRRTESRIVSYFLWASPPMITFMLIIAIMLQL